jgi:plasmid stabilization system protein ParE
VVPEFERADLRERFVFSYRVIYQVRPDAIVVVNVIHGHRLYSPDTAGLSDDGGGAG